MKTTKPLDVRSRPDGARLVLLLLAAACATGAEAASAAPAGAPAPGGQFAPPSGAASYGADEGRKCQRSQVSKYVLDLLADAAKDAKRPVPEADGRVCAVAEAFLGWAPGVLPRPQVLAFASSWYGLPGAVRPPIVAEFEERDQRIIAERVVQSAAGTAALNAVHPRIGIATRQTRKGRQTLTRIAVVVADVPVELAPVPRRLERGQQAKLSGRLVGGVRNPKVSVTDAAGKLSTPEQPPGEAFEATLTCGDRPGRIQVEIRGEHEGSTGVVASFPVSCAVSPPPSIALEGEPWPTEPRAAERKMFELVNAERSASGVPPLTWDDGVAGVARAISEDIARSGAAGGGDLVARLKKEGIATPLILQSAAADRTFERAHERILASPRDRATVLSPEATHAGVGAVSTKDAQGNPIVYVTEVLIKQLPPVDVTKARQQLRDAVAQKRKDARTSALEDDPTLDATAQRYAEALAAAGGALPKERHGQLTAPLNKDFKSVTMVSGAKQEPLDFAEEPQTTAPARALGVGVAQGIHPVLGRNATYVVLMVGTPRAADAPAKRKATAKKPRR